MKWISAAEKMPGRGERVLIYTPYEFFGQDHACIGDTESIRICKTKIAGEMVPIFTHWMPLPRHPDFQ